MIIRYIIIVLCIICIFSLSAYGEEATVYKHVYYSRISDEENGYFTDLEDALAKVADGGRVYIEKDIVITQFSNNHPINKSVEIIGRKPLKYQLIFNDKLYLPAFNLKSTNYFKIEGIHARANRGKVITGSCSNIVVENTIFDNCDSIEITKPKQRINLYLRNNQFYGYQSFKIDMKDLMGYIDLSDNHFEKEEHITVNLNNLNITSTNNIFNNIRMLIDATENINVKFTKNTFSGEEGRITIRAHGEDIHFNKNKILLNSNIDINYTEDIAVDFTKNWWGRFEGPHRDRILGNVDWGDWALFKDFTRFKDDPYTMKDLKKGALKVGQAVDIDEFKIYDLNENDLIDFLDLVWITRILD